MIRIIADDKIPFLAGALEPFASVRYLDSRHISRAAVEDADALLIRTRTICNEALLQGSRVKFIGTATIGFDHIDTLYCEANSIHWVSAPGCNSSSVQQYIASVLASLAMKHSSSLKGKTLGIIGVGHVGRKVERLAAILGMHVLLNDPPRARNEGNKGFVSLEQLLSGSDIITLHVPLNKSGVDKTLQMINETTLGFFKPGSVLINSSRGEVVDGDALKKALSSGRISNAVLDVWEHEPVVDHDLLDKVNIATPHIAGYSIEGKRNGTVQVVQSLGAYFGLPLTQWNPSGIPQPEDPFIVMDSKDRSLEQLVLRAILHTYDVTSDDARFRSDPGNFEKLRGNYPVRREFQAFKIVLLHGSPETIKTLESIGFTVI